MFQAVVTFLRTCQTSFETVTVLHSLVFPNVTETRRLIKKKNTRHRLKTPLRLIPPSGGILLGFFFLLKKKHSTQTKDL